MAADPASLRTLADLLDEDDIYDLAAGAIAEARDRAARHPQDRDSAEVLDHLIDVLRAAADSAT
jgi:hypothetical protein